MLNDIIYITFINLMGKQSFAHLFCPRSTSFGLAGIGAITTDDVVAFDVERMMKAYVGMAS